MAVIKIISALVLSESIQHWDRQHPNPNCSATNHYCWVLCFSAGKEATRPFLRQVFAGECMIWRALLSSWWDCSNSVSCNYYTQANTQLLFSKRAWFLQYQSKETMGCKACCIESWRKSTLGSRECWEWQAALSLFSFSTSPSVWMSGTSHFPQRAACFLCYPTKQHPTLRTKADIPTGMQNNLAFFRIRFIVGSSFPVGHSSFSSSPPVNLSLCSDFTHGLGWPGF